MKILHIIPSLNENLDGPANVISRMCHSLIKKGLEITIYTTDLYSINYESLTGFELKVFKTLKGSNYCFGRSFVKTLKEYIDRYDLVHIHSAWVYPSTVAAYICRKKNIPYIIRPCGMLDHYSIYHDKLKGLKKLLYFYLFDKRNFNKASAIHFTSREESKKTAHMKIKAPSFVLPVGISKDEFLSLPDRGRFRDAHPVLRDKKIILFLGRIHYKKGLDILVDAFRKISSKSDDAFLVIAGPDNDGYESVIRNKINELKISDRVLFTGLVKDEKKLELLADSDIFALPSFQENLGIAVVEAMAAGLPVVISDQVNIHDEISRAEAGIVTGCDSDATADALLKLVNDERLRTSMAVNARRLALEKYSWDSIADALITHYQHVIDAHKK